MNDKQKWSLIIGAMSLVIWVTSTLNAESYFRLEELFEFESLISAISFGIGLGSLVGYFIFKDN